MTGPVEYLVVGFPDGTVSDDLAPELAKLVDNEVIRILDLVVLTKNTFGDVTVAEFDELDEFASFTEIDAEVGGLISAEDIDFVGDDLDPGSAAAVLLVEDVWATSLADALDRSGGFMLDGARIPRDLADAAIAGLPTTCPDPDCTQSTTPSPKGNQHHAPTSHRPQGRQDGHHRQVRPAPRPPGGKAPAQAPVGPAVSRLRAQAIRRSTRSPPQARDVGARERKKSTMIDSPSYSGAGSASGDDTHALFGQTMGYVAATAGFFALGAYAGRDLSYGWTFVGFIAALACLIGMNFTVRQSGSASVGLLFAFGLLLGLAMSPTLTYYAGVNPQALWQAGGATALFIAGCGAAGYATRRDLSGVARMGFWALVALIMFGVLMIFVNIPGGSLAYSILGLVIFAGLTMSDFQRLRRSKDIDSAPLMAASIFLDALNVFQFFLQIFSRNER